MAEMNVFNLKQMADETLVEKYNELLKKSNYMRRFSTSVEAIHQIQMMLEMINAERNERMFMDTWRMVYPHISDPIETDPDLNEAFKLKKEQSKPVEKKPSRIKMSDRRVVATVPVATRTPVIPSSKEEKNER